MTTKKTSSKEQKTNFFTGISLKKQIPKQNQGQIYAVENKTAVGIWISAAALGVILGYTFYMSPAGILFVLPILFCYVRYMFHRAEEKNKNAMEIQFKDAMVTLTSALQTGYALSRAFEEAWKVSITVYGQNSMIAELLSKYVEGQRLNIPVEQLLKEMEVRSQLPIVSELTDVIRITRQYGGNLPNLIQQQTKVTEENLILKSELLSTTASLRYEAYIMDLIPVGIIWYLKLTGAGAMTQVYHTVFGYIFMSICLYIYMAAVLWQFLIMEKVTV